MRHRILRKKSPIPGVKTQIPLYPAARFADKRSAKVNRAAGRHTGSPPTPIALLQLQSAPTGALRQHNYNTYHPKK